MRTGDIIFGVYLAVVLAVWVGVTLHELKKEASPKAEEGALIVGMAMFPAMGWPLFVPLWLLGAGAAAVVRKMQKQ